MKTTNNNSKVSKKEIINTLRTLDSTRIFSLYKKIYGEINRSGICKFIREYAPSQSIAMKAYDLAYPTKHDNVRIMCETGNIIFKLNYIVEYLKEQLKDTKSNYAKRPMLSKNNLYFCSPIYGFSDYNHWCALPIEGNERFCEVIVKYADKYFC